MILTVIKRMTTIMIRLKMINNNYNNQCEPVIIRKMMERMKMTIIVKNDDNT